MKYYILKGKVPIVVNDVIEWGKWFEKADRHVDKTKITDKIEVSTVFLGLDHAFISGTPLLFETMIFGGKHDGYQERYTTWDEAEAGHLVAVKLCGKRIS
jgi:hypothetical protein